MQPLFRALIVLAFAAVAVDAQQEPPRRLDFTREADQQPAADTIVERQAGETSREMRTAFVRAQTILGLGVYGPSFAVMVGTEPATRTAAYLVMAGGTFFAATELSRQVEITPARHFLSSRMAWRGAGTGLLLSDVTNVRSGEAGAMTLLGGLGGTTAGLLIGRGLTEGEAVATVAGHDLAFASAAALTYVISPGGGGDGMSHTTRLAIPVIAGWGGYALGRYYAGNAPYEVTAGDANLLWLGAAIGATAGIAAVAETDPKPQTLAGAVLVGGLAGVWGADRWLVRKFDHTRPEGALVALGGLAGSVMGIGLGVLISGEAERWDGATLGFAALGAVGGVFLTERYVQAAPDAGREQFGFLERLQFSPGAALAAATNTPGVHPIVRFTF